MRQQTLYLIKMKQRSKVSIEEVKYIQTQIERLLNLHDYSQNPIKSQLEPSKDKFSSFVTTVSRNEEQTKKYSKTTYATPKKETQNNNTNNSPSKLSQKSTKKKVNSISPKGKTKKQQNSGSENKDIKKRAVTNLNLSSVIQQRPYLEEEKQFNQIQPVKKSTKQSQFSPRQLKKKWALIQKGVTKSIQLQSQRLLNQVSNNKEKKTGSYLEKSNRSQSLGKKSIQEIKSSKKDENSSMKKRFFPHGLIQVVKKKKHKTDSFHSVDVLYPTAKQEKKPYYLNNKNGFPLRDDEDYLQRKFKQKKQIKQKKQDLLLKYHVLDQRLNRLREQIQTEPITARFQRFDAKSKLKAKKKYQQALQNYLRFSPLNKLLKTNNKMKTQHQKSISSQYRKMTLNQNKYKELFEYGRPIWNA